MNKYDNFFLGFVMGIGLFVFMALIPIQNPTDPNIIDLFNYVQGRQWRILQASPTLNQLLEDEFVVVRTSITTSIYGRDNKTLWRVALTTN